MLTSAAVSLTWLLRNGPPPCGLYQHGLPRSGASGVMSFARCARVAVEVRYGWLCVVGVSGANAPVNAQPHQKIAAMLGRPGRSTAWCVDGGQCPLLALSGRANRAY